MNRKLLLFDIDGTLLDTGGAGLSAIARAVETTFGIDADFPAIELAGSTDDGIVKSLFAHFDIPETRENKRRFYAAYLLELRANLTHSLHRGRLLPGVENLLQTLKRDTPHIIALLTGNIREGAFAKVSHYGIGEYFEIGAFGDDHHDRNELGPIAVRRANDHHDHTFTSEDVIVIGDTPKDIRCALAINARVITVATGTFSREDLETHRPHHLFDTLEDTPSVLAAIEAE